MLKHDHCHSITSIFEQQASVATDRTALISGGEQLSFGELNALSNQWAHHLTALGVTSNVLVGVCAERSVELVVAALAVLKAGGAYVPLNPEHPRERLSLLLAEINAPVVLAQKKLVLKLPENTNMLHLETDAATVRNRSQCDPEHAIGEDDPSYVIYTSGSTGAPKGVVVPHRALYNHMMWMQRALPLTSEDRVLQRTPFSFDASVWEVFAPLLTGATLVLARPGGHKDSYSLIDEIRSKQITILQVVPSLLRMLVDTPDLERCTSLRRVFCGGEALDANLCRAFRARLPGTSLYNLYGPTEACIDATFYAVDDEPRDGTVPIGHPIDHTRVYVLDENRRPVPKGQPGELYIGGRGVALGYLNRPDLTARAFLPDPKGRRPGARMYKTGDLGRMRHDGALEFLGRIDSQVKIRGHRIEPAEIESLLRQHHEVHDAAVKVHETTPYDKRLVAYVVQSDRENVEDRTVQWGRIWDEAYREPASEWDPKLHIGGWIDSFTGKSLPVEHVKEWVDHTVDRILSLSPKRVLEIGCGTGMLLLRIAPVCTSYLGTDISQEAIRYVGAQLREPTLQPIVTLAEAPAHRLPDISAGAIDTVVINSVIAMFPSMKYLVDVLVRLVELVAPGGAIFLGDIESRPLQRTLHTAIQLHQADEELLISELHRRIDDRIAQDNKLFIDPAFFSVLQQRLARIGSVEVELKRGRYRNELTKFRYDVILRIGRTRCPPPPLELDWQPAHPTITGVRDQLAKTAPNSLRIKGVQDARVWSDVQAFKLLQDSRCPANVRELRAQLRALENVGIEPEDWWALADNSDYIVQLSPTGDGRYDVLLTRSDGTREDSYPNPEESDTEVDARSFADFGTRPMQSGPALAPTLRTFLSQWLPAVSIPSAFVFLDALPLGSNGKLDRSSLPEPPRERPSLARAPIAPRTPTEEILARSWARTLGIKAIGIHDNFFELGGHSLLILQLFSDVRDAFGVTLPLRCMFESPTVAEMAHALSELAPGGAQTTLEQMTVADLLADAHLDPEIVPADGLIREEHETVLLTGATGFLGVFVLDELLRSTTARVICVVRSCDNDTAAARRLRENAERYGIASLHSDAWNDRVVPLIGDLAQPRFGLDAEHFDELAEEIDLIYHIGASVNILYPYAAMWATNVRGTQEILRLAARVRPKPVHYISSTGVFESLGYSGLHPAIREDAPLEACEAVYGGYCQSKWVAEKLIETARTRGIQARIYRPGLISGHTQTGACNTDDMLCRLLRYFIEQGRAPDLDISIDMTPVDYVSRAIVELSRQCDERHTTFHLANPRSLRLGPLIDELRAYGYAIGRVDYSTWLAALRESTTENSSTLGAMVQVLTSPLPGSSLSYLEMTSLGMLFDCTNAERGLRKIPVSCPPVDSELLRPFLAYMIRCCALPPPVHRRVHPRPIIDGFDCQQATTITKLEMS